MIHVANMLFVKLHLTEQLAAVQLDGQEILILNVTIMSAKSIRTVLVTKPAKTTNVLILALQQSVEPEHFVKWTSILPFVYVHLVYKATH
jgi:hypothetical protein